MLRSRSDFWGATFRRRGKAAYLPESREETQVLLELHLLEKAVYELGYELNNRPTWVGIPLQGISRTFVDLARWPFGDYFSRPCFAFRV